nr:hypothetical protein [Streptomyces polyasparticus]
MTISHAPPQPGTPEISLEKGPVISAGPELEALASTRTHRTRIPR